LWQDRVRAGEQQHGARRQQIRARFQKYFFCDRKSNTEYRQKKLLYNRGTPWHRGTVFAGGEQILNRQN
jgi:hypothetical protein